MKGEEASKTRILVQSTTCYASATVTIPPLKFFLISCQVNNVGLRTLVDLSFPALNHVLVHKLGVLNHSNIHLQLSFALLWIVSPCSKAPLRFLLR